MSGTLLLSTQGIKGMRMKKRPGALILANEKSGIGKAGNRLMEVIRKAAAKGYEPIVYPIIPGTELTSDDLLPLYDGRIELVVGCGGDGTMNHIVNAIMTMEHKPRVAYLPMGSTNDFAKGMGIPITRPKAIETAFAGQPFTYDLGCLNGRFFNYVAAFGTFSDVSYETKQSWKNVLGYAAYVITAAGKLIQNTKYKKDMRIETDTGDIEGKFLFGAVCNTATVGGLNLLSKADIHLDDGKMELLLIYDTSSLIELQGIATTLLAGSSDHPNISLRQVNRAVFHCEEMVPWALDGEFGGETKTAEIEVHEKAITIMTGTPGIVGKKKKAK